MKYLKMSYSWKARDVIGYHRKFSFIQKIILIFLILGILALFSLKLLFVFIFYIFITGSTFVVCQYLISSKHNFKFLLTIYLHLRGYGHLFITVLNIKAKLQEIFTTNEESLIEEEFKSEDGECFYDANESNVINEPDSINIQLTSTQNDVNWQEEVVLITNLIQKHFVYTWLKDFDPHIDVITEFDRVLQDGTRSLISRLQAVDPNDMVKELCLYSRQHLRTLQISRDKFKTQPRRRLSLGRRDSGSGSASGRKYASVEEAFEMISTYHIGLYGNDNEVNYLYSICDILLNRTFGSTILNCQVSNFLLSEILMCNVFFPVVDMLSEPDFIFENLILILSNEPLDVPLNDEDLLHDESVTVPVQRTEINENSSNCINTHNQIPPERLLNQTGSEAFENNHLHPFIDNDKEEKFLPNVPMALIQPALSISEIEKDTLSTEKNSPKLKLDKNEVNDIASLKQTKPDFFLSCEEEQPENYMSSLEIIEQKPAIFQDVLIVDNEIHNESRSTSQFVLYTLQCDALYWIDAQKDPVLRTRQVKRRHREFINLHARLTDNPNYKISLKGIKGPKRWQTLPFGNLNKKSIEDRRKTLETYIKSLIEKEDICNGPEMKEFLAYEGDAHIAFVRKTPELSVPRFDKMIARTMSGVFDEIIKIPSRVSFPTLPGKKDVNKELEKEDSDQINIEFDIDSKYGSQEETIQEFVVICDENSELTENIPEKKLNKLPGLLKEDDISLAEAVVDIGVQTLQGQDNWICRERVIIIIKHLIGIILDRWLKEQIEDLTSEEMCVKYLRLLRETVWPEGELFEGGRPVKTDRQKSATKEQARRCLAELFPDTLKSVIGKEDFDHGINEIIESLQYKKLNRHLIYTLLDHLADILYPEIRSRRSSKM